MMKYAKKEVRGKTALQMIPSRAPIYRPLFDFMSPEYRSSIINRLNFGLQRSFYNIGSA